MATPHYLTVDSLTPREIKRLTKQIHIDLTTGCWVWTGSLSGKPPGYGTTFYRGKAERTHRLMYAILRGPVPRGVSRDIPVLDHTCNNPHCCNPYHLELTPQRDNILRGTGACASNMRKTHCPKGHPLPEQPNLSYGKARRCMTCLLEKRQANKAKKAAYDRAYRERSKPRKAAALSSSSVAPGGK